ncbi:cryptochrome/photolyase family protein [Maribacter algicola]|uniref:Cryptochrome/photolyase family protein n=1 Tax=Meishania litoralis TaxID=3434685 RepID=A0ACC7LNY4_9FLAO
MPNKISVFWFRRDLRLNDNVGFQNALLGDHPVMPIFIFDSTILERLPRNDARVSFIYQTLQNLRKKLQEDYNSSIAFYYGKPSDVFGKIATNHGIQAVYTNRDYEPYARKRDREIELLLADKGVEFRTFKDQVVFEKDEIVKDDGDPYVVYTPYKNKWKEKFNAEKDLKTYNTEPHFDNLIRQTRLPDLTLGEIGFENSPIKVPHYVVSSELIAGYEDTRNFPAIEKGTSRLGPHLRFGTVSVREIIKKVTADPNETFWNELIWREFFMQILWHYPSTETKSFKPKYDRIAWRNNEEEFRKWCEGQTGFALVDAGMRELNETGYMHNRVRMLVASFLCKHLLIDWRWGEAYFAEKLLDYDMSANVGNWQWAAGSGVDAAPYFRIFNPMTQVDKFDKQKEYIKRWVPELQELTYPEKMVDHKLARERCLKTYKEALN